MLPGSRYPLFFLDDLDSKRPNKVQLLGKNIVVWQAPDGSWSALEDLCPHRLAPLSGAAHVVSSSVFAKAVADGVYVGGVRPGAFSGFRPTAVL